MKGVSHSHKHRNLSHESTVLLSCMERFSIFPLQPELQQLLKWVKVAHSSGHLGGERGKDVGSPLQTPSYVLSNTISSEDLASFEGTNLACKSECTCAMCYSSNKLLLNLLMCVLIIGSTVDALLVKLEEQCTYTDHPAYLKPLKH